MSLWTAMDGHLDGHHAFWFHLSISLSKSKETREHTKGDRPQYVRPKEKAISIIMGISTRMWCSFIEFYHLTINADLYDIHVCQQSNQGVNKYKGRWVLHTQNWYSLWGRRFYFKVAAESSPSWGTIRGGLLSTVVTRCVKIVGNELHAPSQWNILFKSGANCLLSHSGSCLPPSSF